MRREIVTSVAYRVAACLATIIVLEVILGKGGLVSGFLHLDPSLLLRPLQYTCTLLFTSSILRVALAGELATPLVSSLKILTFGLFFYLLFTQHPMLAEFSPFGFWVFACSATAAFKRTMSAILSSYHIHHLNYLLTYISVFLAGYFSSMMLHAFSRYINFTFLASIDTIILYTSIFVLAFSLLGLLSRSRNPYASYFGEVFTKTSNIFGLFILVTIIQIYFFNLRPTLLDDFPWYVSSLEWAAVCLVALVAFMRAKSYVSHVLSEELRFGEWRKHIQKIVHEKGELESASKAVSLFIEEGVKEGVIVYLTSILLRNGVPFPEIERVVRSIVYYEDIPLPRLALAPSLESLRERNRSRRMKVFMSALKETTNSLHLPAPLINVGGEPGENREV